MDGTKPHTDGVNPNHCLAECSISGHVPGCSQFPRTAVEPPEWVRKLLEVPPAATPPAATPAIELEQQFGTLVPILVDAIDQHRDKLEAHHRATRLPFLVRDFALAIASGPTLLGIRPSQLGGKNRQEIVAIIDPATLAQMATDYAKDLDAALTKLEHAREFS